MAVSSWIGLDTSSWWFAVLSTSVVLAVAISVLVPLGFFSDGKKEGREELEGSGGGKASKRGTAEDDDRPLHEEPWVPKMETKDWREAAQLPGCPWSFDGCDDEQDVLECIWRAPLCKDMQAALTTLKTRVKGIQVAKVSLSWPQEVHFAAVYTLSSGAELFGGPPLDIAVELEMTSADSGARSQLRQRRSRSSPSNRKSSEAPDVKLPCLMPFYRVHNGFGVLLSTKHLPMLLSSPGDSISGSCYYVYPSHALETEPRWPSLVRFARIDRSCGACADVRQEQPTVTYVERHQSPVRDDEPLLPFIADTISNIAGQRVVPPSYMGGPAPIIPVDE